MCTVSGARERHLTGDIEGALREAGALLEADPFNDHAWLLAAVALSDLGYREKGVHHLNRLARAAGERGAALMAILATKTLQGLGADTTVLSTDLARRFALALDTPVTHTPQPPPLPPSARCLPWAQEHETDALAERIDDSMTRAALRREGLQSTDRVPPTVPILSNLDIPNFPIFINILSIEYMPGNQIILEQGSDGDALYIIVEGRVAVIRRDPDNRSTPLATLGPDAFFGEMALVSRTPRAAEVQTLEPTVLFKLDRGQVERLSETAPKIGEVLVAFCHARMLENLIRISPVLSPVPPEKRPALIDAFDTDYKTAGEIITHEGDKGAGLYLIVSGEVEVLKKTADGEHRVATLGPGDVLGEIALIMRKPSTATLRATRHSALLFLSADAFMTVTGQFPEFLKGVFDIAIGRDTENNSILATDKGSVDEWCLL